MDTNGLEVIQTNEQQEAKEIQLTNGDKVLIHQEQAYDDFYTDGKSFDEVGNGENLRFEFIVKLHRDGLSKMEKAGNVIRSNPMMVHHNHVVWMYSAGLHLVDENLKSCQLVLTSLGSSFKQKDAVPKGAFGNNVSMRQSAPMASASCSLIIKGDQKEFSIPMEKYGDGFKSTETLTLEQLMNAMSEETTVHLKLSLTIEKHYFSLKKLMETNLENPDVIPGAESVLETVLKGEKTSQWDWVITVGEGSPREWFVHKQVLAYSSPLLESAMRSHSSIGQDQVLMVSHENRFILPKIHAEDMPVILTYFYTRRFLLPKYDAFARVGRLLCTLFPHFAIANFFLHWEAAIVKDVLALDNKNYEKTLPACARHLVSIYSAPYGAMPAAKKVIISTMADSWHMAESRGENVDEKMKKEEVFKTKLLEPAMNSVQRFKTVAAAVKKTAF